MPDFNFDPTQVAAVGGFEVLPKGDYEFIIGKPKPFQKLEDNGDIRNFGLGVTVKVADGEHIDKLQYVRLYMHNRGSQGFSKAFVMACYGYAKNQEKEFNEAFAGKSWNYNAETGEIGEVWQGIEGKRAIGSADTQMGQGDYAGQEQQKFTGWRPIG
jgi:hypothetical protein